ncbi:MAG: site-specific integrase [Terricaulis sp.]
MADPKPLGGNRWAARPRLNGRQHYVVVRAPGIRKARELVAAEIERLRRGEVTPGAKPTFLEAAERWIATATMAPATAVNHRAMLARCSSIASMRVDKISVADVEQIIDAMTPSNGRKTLSLISGTFKDCIRLGELPNLRDVNVALRARRPPTVKRREVELTPDEVRSVIAAARPEAAGLALLFIAHTGLRRSELIALRWEEIDLEARTASIVRRASGGIVVDGTKTRAGTRRAPLWPGALAVLERMRALGSVEGFIWSPVPDGSIAYRAGWLTHACYEAAKLAGVDCSPHSLRHFGATMLAERGIPVPSIAGFLGHASVATLGYLHPVAATVVEAAGVLDEVLSARELPAAVVGPEAELE